MLSSLHISNYILIDSLDIRFPEGLVIITGQTGAGKSIILGALSLVAGARADASLISAGSETCVVEAEFEDAGEEIRSILEDNDLEWDNGRITVRRVIHSSGRSRSFINDCPVQLSVLQDLSGHLIDIHSQHKSLLLTDRRFQLNILDLFAGNADLLSACREKWSELQALEKELAGLVSSRDKVTADRDYNEAQYRQLEAAALKPDELESLEAEQRSLANAELIKESLSTALSLFEPSEYPGISSSMADARKQLERISPFVPDAARLAGRLESVRLEFDDISSELSDIFMRSEMSPERLTEVEDRMSLLYSLLKKHGCRTVSDLVDLRDRLGGELFDADSLNERIAELESRISACHEEYGSICAELSGSRRNSARSFSDAIRSSLRYLELDNAVFCVSLEDAPDGPAGRDRVTFLFSSTGSAPVDVAKCASGGEISRIMLSLKAMMAKYVGMPTLIFDEIDTGVSGSVADRMGSMICSMGKDMQVFSITHLPQVAAKGDAHYVVSKELASDGRTVSSIRRISGKERVNEIARLLSGTTITDAAIANAESLLNGD